MTGGLARLDGEQAAKFELAPIVGDNCRHDVGHVGTLKRLNADPNDGWSVLPADHEQGMEIRIECNNDRSCGGRVRDDVQIRSG